MRTDLTFGGSTAYSYSNHINFRQFDYISSSSGFGNLAIHAGNFTSLARVNKNDALWGFLGGEEMGEGGGHRAYNLMDRYSKATHQILCSENKEKGQDARRAPNCSVLQQKENTHTHTHTGEHDQTHLHICFLPE